jgi:hexosaminidase
MSRLQLVRAGVAALVAAAVAADSLWPTPASVEMQTGDCVVIPPTATMEATGYTSDVLTDAMKRYTAIIFGRRSPSWAPSYAGCKPIPFRVIQVQVTSPNLTLGLETDESYQLTVQYTGYVNLVAPTAYGAVRGLETLSQLVDYDPPSGNFYATVGEIVDAPVFRHRGALLDTSRHFLPLSAILAFIDALSYNKVNVLHWHIVDDPSFPYVSAAYPSLSAQGAYGAPNATVATAHTYPPADVQAVINYARLRGIRTLAEFDTPGHSGSWGLGQPGLLTQCYNTTTGQPIPGSFGPIDPTNPANFGFLQGLLSEVATVFPDRYLHVGGDEVSFTCWASSPAINAWMAANGIPAGNYAALEGYYVQKVLDMVNTLPPAGTKAPMAWQEVFDNGLRLAPDTVVAVWKYHSTSAPAPEEAGGVTAAPTLTWQSEVYNVTAAGFRTVVSSPWYLNYM